MKKLLLLSLLFAFTGSAFAQLPSFDLGLKAGMNVAKLKLKDKADTFSEENRLGYQFGVWARLGGAGLYVQPELYVAGKGGKYNIDNEGINEDVKVSLTTLDLPILLGTKVGLGPVNARVMAGPVVSFKLSDDVKLKDKISNAYTDIRDIKNYKSNAVGIQLGAGVDISKLAIDLRYEVGVSNINKTDKYDQKQNLWHISLGYKLL